MKNARELFELQLRQLNRLVNETKTEFSLAFYIIFSDYPTSSFIKTIESETQFSSSDKYSKKIINEMTDYLLFDI